MDTATFLQEATLTDSQLIDLYTCISLPRMIEERMLSLLRQGKLSKWFSGIGQEAISVGSTYALNKNDIVFPMHRNLGVFTTRQLDLKQLFRQLLGKSGGFTKGRDRSFHFGSPQHHIIGMISHLAAMLPVANGVSLAFQLKKEKRVALTFTGDGATSEGDFHEALNLAAVWKLPIIFLIENNGYALSTPVSEQYACKRLCDRADGYGMEGLHIDGNDVIAVYQSVRYAAEKARQGQGPTLIEAETFRMRGHEEASGIKYVPRKLLENWQKKDPIARFEQFLTAKGLFSEKICTQIQTAHSSRIEAALTDALAAPLPTSTIAEERQDVFCTKQPSVPRLSSQHHSREKRYIDAISEALWQTMTLNPNIILLGQDIAEYGGVFKVTEGFLEKFGKSRLKNTPIIESGAIGAAIGLALEGFTAVVEMQFADFVSCGFNQIVNNLAKTHYRWQTPLNVTLRLPSGGGMSAGPFHSQCPEAWFFHVPGLKIIAPSNPYDAKGLLISALYDPNPIIFLEHKGLYRSAKGQIPEDPYTIEIGKADIKRTGGDLTIVSYGMAVQWALEAAETFSQDGIEIEVLDLRSLIPWDKEAVLASLRKTNRIIILHEANLTGGVGAEIAAFVSEEGFQYLDAPVMRIASLDTPIPFSPELERHIYFPRERISQQIHSLLAF